MPIKTISSKVQILKDGEVVGSMPCTFDNDEKLLDHHELPEELCAGAGVISFSFSADADNIKWDQFINRNLAGM